MKLKISLFLFALGLGASSAYAGPAQDACLERCALVWQGCVGRFATPEVNQFCADQRLDCEYYCETH